MLTSPSTFTTFTVRIQLIAGHFVTYPYLLFIDCTVSRRLFHFHYVQHWFIHHLVYPPDQWNEKMNKSAKSSWQHKLQQTLDAKKCDTKICKHMFFSVLPPFIAFFWIIVLRDAAKKKRGENSRLSRSSSSSSVRLFAFSLLYQKAQQRHQNTMQAPTEIYCPSFAVRHCQSTEAAPRRSTSTPAPERRVGWKCNRLVNSINPPLPLRCWLRIRSTLSESATAISERTEMGLLAMLPTWIHEEIVVDDRHHLAVQEVGTLKRNDAK